MSRRTLVFAVLSTLVLSTAACNSALGPSAAPFSASQGADNPVGDGRGLSTPDATQPHLSNGADDPATHDVGDDRGVDDPAGHDVGDDNGVDDPAGHDVGDDHGGDRGDNGSGRGGADDPANHQ